MGVYIKGMEMPKSCWDCEVGGAKQMDNATCPFCSMEYWEQDNYRDKIADGCPLVPVPPHGRLIDVDALIARHEFEAHHHTVCDEFDKGRLAGWNDVIRAIRGYVPTIIEAEEGE